MAKNSELRPTDLADSVLRGDASRETRATSHGDRAEREVNSREATARAKPWSPPSILPEPPELDGWVHRWVRTGIMGQIDHRNVSMRFREGWEACKAEDYPTLVQQVIRDHRSQFPDGIEVGGLLLCRQPKEIAEARKAYYEELARQQTLSVDNNYMRTSDPRMPVLRPDKRTTVTRGQRDEN
jgi:hypothetical protein